MGYTTDDAYVALNKLLAAMNLLWYLLRYSVIQLFKINDLGYTERPIRTLLQKRCLSEPTKN